MVEVRASPAGTGWLCAVTVSTSGVRTKHQVSVSAASVARWAHGDGEADVADLVRRSFEFLLAREPATSILRRFDLSVIQSYFPEYDREFRR